MTVFVIKRTILYRFLINKHAFLP